jgi:hypothetical protein
MTCQRVAIAAVAFSLLTFVRTIEASSVTFDFVSTSGLSAGKTVAILEFNTLPALAPTDVSLFDVVYNGVSPRGHYTTTDVDISRSGSMLAGSITGVFHHTSITISISGVAPTAEITSSAGGSHSLYGNLRPASVPAPSSFMLAGTAVVVGLGTWTRRRLRVRP